MTTGIGFEGGFSFSPLRVIEVWTQSALIPTVDALRMHTLKTLISMYEAL
jgi:hypothetical protein